VVSIHIMFLPVALIENYSNCISEYKRRTLKHGNKDTMIQHFCFTNKYLFITPEMKFFSSDFIAFRFPVILKSFLI
jgi:hypothetical protein